MNPYKSVIDSIIQENEELKKRNKFLENANADLHFELSQYNRTKLLEEISRLKKGIDHAIFCLSNEDITDQYVISQIHMSLVKLYFGEEPEQHSFKF